MYFKITTYKSRLLKYEKKIFAFTALQVLRTSISKHCNLHFYEVDLRKSNLAANRFVTNPKILNLELPELNSEPYWQKLCNFLVFVIQKQTLNFPNFWLVL